MNTESEKPIGGQEAGQELPPSVKNATSIRELLLVVADMEKRYGRPFLPEYPLGEESGKMYGAEGLQTILEKVQKGEENIWAIPEEYGIRKKAVEIFEFESVVNVGIAESLKEIHENFEANRKEAKNLPYHNQLHTTGVMKRVERILLEIQKAAPDLVSDRDIQLARFIASYHDIVQGWRRKIVDDGEFKKETRERFRVKNEKESAFKAIEYMEKISLKKKEYYRSRMLSWTRSQVDFACGREALLDQEIEGIPEEARGRVKLLFSQFSDSITGAEQTAVRREGMTCEEIMKDMGYVI